MKLWKCPRIIHHILITRTPLIDSIAPLGDWVDIIARVFFNREKHNRNFKRPGTTNIGREFG